jgi:hypothetical protein
MIGYLRTISNDEKIEADNDDSLYEDMIFDSLSLCTDDWWDQLWFIYHTWMQNNNITDVPNPSYQRLHPESFEVGYDVGYGKPHYLNPQQTKKVYDFLASVDNEQLVKHALTQEFKDLLHPQYWPEALQPDYDWIIDYMDSLKEYYKEASDSNLGMLQAIA